MTQHNLVKVYRNNVLESIHNVHVAVVDTKGELLLHIGDPDFQAYARSSLKPFQAIPLIKSGASEYFNYTSEEIAISCASHSGESIHRQVVENILSKIDETEASLICGAHVPRDIEGFEQWIKDGNQLTKIFNNCSGKHASMIATCKYTNKDIDSYYQPDHPLQLEIKDLIQDICGISDSNIAVGEDGCGLPVYSFPLKNLAFGFCKLGNPDIIAENNLREAIVKIQDSMITSPYFVAGKNRFDTDAMKILNGKIVSKMGAEGIQGIGVIDKGIGIAIKVEDGANRGADIVGMHVLNHLGVIDKKELEQLLAYYEPEILNTNGKKVGHISFELDFN